MRSSRLTDLDYRPGRFGAVPLRRRRRRRRLLMALATVAAMGLILAFTRSPTAPDGALQPEQLVIELPAADTRRSTQRPKTEPRRRANQDPDWRPGPFLDASLPLPHHHDLATGEPLLMQEIRRLAPPPEPEYDVVTVQSGDSLAAIFDRAGLSPREVHRVVNADEQVKALTRIYPGDEIRFRISDDKRLESLRYQLDETRTLAVDQEGDGFRVSIDEENLETRVLHATGVIDRSFFLSGRRAGLSHGQLMQFMSIFEWQVDFNRDIRNGDAFSVVYEAEYVNGEHLRNGRILAAKLVNRERRINALHFELPDGTSGYFGPDGENLRKAFIRRPVQNARISSGFSRNRKHPVLGVRRPHLGTDFAAPTGTPIMASGSGRVVHRGRKGGFGNAVIIQHSNQYRTIYAHMSRFSNDISVGSRVDQGQVIGYVGRSGLATGPHLHYEFLVNGSHRNPMTVDLPSGDPVPDEHMPEFMAMTSSRLAQLQDANTTELALRDGN